MDDSTKALYDLYPEEDKSDFFPAYEAYEDAGVDPQDIPAAWLGNWQDKAYLLDYSM